MEMVTPTGIISTHDYTSTATGPRVLDMLKGSEGVFGVLTELTIKIFRYMPENRQYFGYMFKDWESAVSAVREVCQGQFGLPAVFRLSDAHETDHGFQMYPQPPIVEKAISLLGYKPKQRCVLMGTVEGEKDFTKMVNRKIAKIVGQHGALSIGGGFAKNWEKDRYETFLVGEAISDYDVIMDTVETSVKWDNVHHIHDAVLAYAHTVPGTLCISHMSHFYPYGSNLYFIFGIRGSVEDYVKYRTALVGAMVKAGGSPILGAPRLAGMEAWYLIRQLENYRDGLRGYRVNDPSGRTMAQTVSLGLTGPTDDADIAAYVESLTH